MLNVGRMAPGGEGYYLATVADGVEDYYLGRGELPGRWLGGGAAALGLEGTVTPEQLRPVLEGLDPASAEPLLTQRQRKVPGFDLTFRAPKSVSLLYGLGDTDTSDQIRRAHDAATDAALGYLEREALWTRRGKGGIERVPTTGAVAAAFLHRTSRAGDPLLHTHVLVANLGQTDDDGRWRTLDSRRIYAHAKTAGYLYQAHLRHELTRRLGVAFEPPTNGAADIVGVPRLVIDAFSQRRAQILQLMAERGESSARAAQVATLDTRQAKPDDLDPVGLREEWRQRAVAMGFDPAELGRLLHRHNLDTTTDVAAVADELAGPDGLTADASTFTRRDTLQGWCNRLPEGLPVEQVEQLANTLLAPEARAAVALDDPDGTVVALTRRDAIRPHRGQAVPALPGHARYSTPDLLALEQRLIAQATRRTDDAVAQAPNEAVDRALAARPSISDEQAAMVCRLTGSGAGVEVVIGKAGTGKTFALDAARAAWQTAGTRVIGAALAARAALELETGAGIDSYTIDRLLADINHPEHGGLAPGTVVVVDEAGMVGTRKLGCLLDAAERDRAKVVLVGDPHQLPEIDAGGLLRGLASRLPVIELIDNRRQRQPWERDALDDLRHGDPSRAIATYGDHGRIVVADTADAVREQLVGDWWHARTETGMDGVMVAARRTDVADLNARARLHMTQAGELAGPTLEAADRPYQAGDHIVCLRNDRRLGVVNGTRATVTAVDLDTRAITVNRDDTAEPCVLPAEYLDAGHVDHAYAITGHKAQGLTTEAAWVLGSDTLYREWGYVAMSRGRQANHLYVVAGDEPDPAGHETPLAEEQRDPVRRVAADLARSRGQHLAVDQASDHLHDLSDADLADQRSLLREAVLATVREQRQHSAAADEIATRRDQLAQQRRQLTQDLQTAQQKLGRCRRKERRTRQGDVERARAAIELCDRQLAALDDQTASPAEHSREAPPGTEIEAFLAAERELERRATARIQAAGFTPPPYIAAAIGTRPEQPSERQQWRAAVDAIERYRATWGIEGSVTPLGDRPRDLAQRREHDAITRQVVAARQRLLDDCDTPDLDRDVPALERA